MQIKKRSEGAEASASPPSHNPRLVVGFQCITLAKNPSEHPHMADMMDAIRAIAREAAHSDNQ